jgi:chemotaxis protein CheC
VTLWWVLKTDECRAAGAKAALVALASPARSSTSARAAVAEAANIVASACLSSIGTMVHARLLPTTPDVRELTVSTLVGKPDSDALRTVLGASFVSTNAPTFSGWLVLLVDEATREALLRRLGL